MRRTISTVLVILALATAVLAQSNLTFVARAEDSHNRMYKAYIDLDSKHLEGRYSTATTYALWDSVVTTQGYSGIKWYRNTYQMDCARNVKRVTYIAYLDINGNVIVDDSYPDAPDEQLSGDPEIVDMKLKPFLCGK